MRKTTLLMSASFAAALFAFPALAESMSEHSSQGPGHDHGQAQGSSHGGTTTHVTVTHHVAPTAPTSKTAPQPNTPVSPTEEGRMTDAELEANDLQANDPNYEPDPNDPVCGDCEPAPPGAEGYEEGAE